jgi:hypothetical protein
VKWNQSPQPPAWQIALMAIALVTMSAIEPIVDGLCRLIGIR